MKLIKPSEISAGILTLLDECDERVIIVSPYMKISKWFKFVHKMNGLKTRKISIEIYVRDDPENKATYRDLDRLALDYIKIPNLHSKLYMNEKSGIVTSMNLLLSSEINSLEIGYATENMDEYNELLGYYYRHIHSGETSHSDHPTSQSRANLEKMKFDMRKELEKSGLNVSLLLTDNTLRIVTGFNNYNISIDKGNLRISGSIHTGPPVNQKKNEHACLIAKRIADLTTMDVSAHPWSEEESLRLTAQASLSLKSNCIQGLMEGEAGIFMSSVIKLIKATYDSTAR